MIKVISTIIIMVSIWRCTSLQSVKLSKYSTQGYPCIEYPNPLPDSIKKLIHWNYLDSLAYSKASDTVYIVEQNGIQGEFNIMLWNKTTTLSYTNESGVIERTEKTLFPQYMRKLVSEWNATGIREEEKKHKVVLPEDRIYAAQLIFQNGRCSMAFLAFYDFFDLERDRNIIRNE